MQVTRNYWAQTKYKDIAMRFNVTEFLNYHNISYKTSGGNIAAGWVGAQECPFCGDRSYHLGINLYSGGFSCWVCGHTGWIYEYIQRYMGLTEKEVKQTGRVFFTDDGSTYRKKVVEHSVELTFPPTFQDLTQPYITYLERRRFDISIAQRYNLKCADKVDPHWAYRLIIPFYAERELVAWTARTIFKDVDPRYKNIPNQLARIDVRSTLYNIDSLRRKSVIVEGATDTWRIGGACAAIIGLHFTNAQILAIKNKGVEEATIIFDGEQEAYARAVELAKNLDMIGVSASVIRLPDGVDPGELSDEDASEIRRMCM